jgi:hypothetical protein
MDGRKALIPEDTDIGACSSGMQADNKRAQAMHKELRVAWGIAVERLSATWGDWCLACGQKRSITVCISQCNRKSLLYPASVERDCSAHPCPLSGQPFRSSFCVPDDSIHTVDSV